MGYLRMDTAATWKRRGVCTSFAFCRVGLDSITQGFELYLEAGTGMDTTGREFRGAFIKKDKSTARFTISVPTEGR